MRVKKAMPQILKEFCESAYSRFWNGSKVKWKLVLTINDSKSLACANLLILCLSIRGERPNLECVFFSELMRCGNMRINGMQDGIYNWRGLKLEGIKRSVCPNNLESTVSGSLDVLQDWHPVGACLKRMALAIKWSALLITKGQVWGWLED